MITERTLKKWRKEALKETIFKPVTGEDISILVHKELQCRILRMTQELLDQHLVRRD